MKDFEKFMECILEDEKTAMIVADGEGISVKGYTPTLMMMYAAITNRMRELKGATDEMVRKAFEIGMEDNTEEADDELEDELVESLKKLRNKLDEFLKEETSKDE